MSRRRHGAGQDGAGAGAARSSAVATKAGPIAGRRAAIAGVQLEGRSASGSRRELRVLDHTGINRTRAADHFADFDLILTTYGTLRRDAAFLKDTTFDYVILDEAQAIKNSSTEAAKGDAPASRPASAGADAARRSRIGWRSCGACSSSSIPACSARVSVFRSLVGSEQERRRAAQVLARALRPFILRRTKQQVATDLPEKLEQTIFCELEEQAAQALRRAARALSPVAARHTSIASASTSRRCRFSKRCSGCARRRVIRA